MPIPGGACAPAIVKSALGLPFGPLFKSDLAKVRAAPGGIDLGELAPRLPELLRPPSGKVELAPAALLADLPGYGYAAVPQDLKRHWQEFLARCRGQFDFVLDQCLLFGGLGFRGLGFRYFPFFIFLRLLFCPDGRFPFALRQVGLSFPFI